MLDLIAELASARRSKGLSQPRLAGMVGSDRQGIARLEIGIGSVELICRVMIALDMRLVGVGMGATLPAQLAAARSRRKWTLEDVASKSGVSRQTVAEIEAGRGSVASLVAVMRAVAPRAKVSEPLRVSWDYNHKDSAEKDVRFTPPWYLEAVRSVWGPISLDPCHHPLSYTEPTRSISLPQDGLAECWQDSRLAYVNPPFSHASRWFSKACHEFKRGGIERLVMLTPTRTDTAAFVEVHKAADVVLLGKRMRFYSAAGELQHPLPFALMTTVFGANDDELDAFRAKVPGALLRKSAPY